MRILITAHDTGAALQNRAFVENCFLKNIDITCKAFLEGPACDVFMRTPISVAKIDVQSDLLHDLPVHDVEKYIDDFDPEFVLLGLSFHGGGIDELVYQFAIEKKIPCGVIQDYWGYLGGGDEYSLPDVFFVLDHEARKLTELKTNGLAKCIVSGSPKHEAYQARLVDWMKKKPLQYQEEKSVVFIGQPSDIIGIQDNFKIFVSTINQVRSSVKIYFKAHPADVGYLAQYRKILEEQSHPYEIIENNIDIEAILYQADVVVTCFSTSGLDHNYLQLYANQPLGELIYLTIGEDLLGFIEKVVGVAEIPGAKSGMGVTCRSDKELLEVLQKYLQGQSSNYQEVVTKCLGSGGSPTQTIFGYIQSLIH